MRGMSKENADKLLHKVSATAIANQAILKCSLAGVPLTIDNVIYFVGDFMNPDEAGGDELAREIEKAITDVLAAGRDIDGGLH
ncbi:hypothetical protein [Rhizobium sp.]